MSKVIYLSGPISNLRPGAATGWRREVSDQLTAAGFTVASPMRGTQTYHSPRKKIRPAEYPTSLPAMSDRALVDRDLHDVTRADIVLVNFIGATEKSLGTIAEAAWCLLLPTVLCVIAVEPGSLHDHPFTRSFGPNFPTLEEAVQFVLSCAPEEPEEEVTDGDTITGS